MPADDGRPRRQRPAKEVVDDAADEQQVADHRETRQLAGLGHLFPQDATAAAGGSEAEILELAAVFVKGGVRALREWLLPTVVPQLDPGTSIVTAGRRFDLALGVGYWLDGSERSCVLEATWIEMLRFLLARPARRASNSEILRHLKRTTAYRGDDPKNVKKLAQRFRKTFELRLGQVLCGRTGEPGGGQRLVLDDAAVP